MRARLAAIAFALVLAVAALPGAEAQILPPTPPVPAPPDELRPLLELLAGPGGTLTEPGCAALGTVLGLGVLVVPGLPGTVESLTGLPLSALPVALQPELLSLVNTLLLVQGSGCGLLPLAAERTVCASDDEIAAALDQVRVLLDVPGLPVQPGDFLPVFAPTAGSVVDAFRTLATLGVPGAAEVVAAMNQVGDCGVRNRFANVEPPPLPPEPTPGRSPILEVAAAPDAGPVASAPVARPSTPLHAGPPPGAVAGPTAPAGDAVVVAPAAAFPAPFAEVPLPRWLQLFAVSALIAFLYRALAPARVR